MIGFSVHANLQDTVSHYQAIFFCSLDCKTIRKIHTVKILFLGTSMLIFCTFTFFVGFLADQNKQNIDDKFCRKSYFSGGNEPQCSCPCIFFCKQHCQPVSYHLGGDGSKCAGAIGDCCFPSDYQLIIFIHVVIAISVICHFHCKYCGFNLHHQQNMANIAFN